MQVMKVIFIKILIELFIVYLLCFPTRNIDMFAMAIPFLNVVCLCFVPYTEGRYGSQEVGGQKILGISQLLRQYTTAGDKK